MQSQTRRILVAAVLVAIYEQQCSLQTEEVSVPREQVLLQTEHVSVHAGAGFRIYGAVEEANATSSETYVSFGGQCCLRCVLHMLCLHRRRRRVTKRVGLSPEPYDCGE